MAALTTPEFYALAATTVGTGGYTSGATTLNVVSTASPFSATNQFRVAITDATSGALKAVLKATAVNSGTAWTVAADALAGSASAGDIVSLVLTASAMDQIRIDSSQSGVYASLPATTGQKSGNVYRCTDAPYLFVFDGSAWQAFTSLKVPQLVAGNFSWHNQQTATETFVDGISVMSMATGSASDWCIRAQAIPSAPFRIRALVDIGVGTTGFPGAGLVLGQTSNSQIIAFQHIANNAPNAMLLQVAKRTNWHSGSGGNYYNSPSGYAGTAFSIWMQIRSDGTNFYWDLSPADDGKIFVNLISEPVTDFLTPADIIGYFVNADSSSPVQMAVRAWIQEATSAIN